MSLDNYTEIDIAKQIAQDDSILDFNYLIAFELAKVYVSNSGYVPNNSTILKLTYAYLICHFLFLEGKCRVLKDFAVDGVDYKLNELKDGESPFLIGLKQINKQGFKSYSLTK